MKMNPPKKNQPSTKISTPIIQPLNVSQMLVKISSVLASKRIPLSPENIVNACFETINELANRKRTDFKELLDIVVHMKEFKPNKLSLNAISASIDLYLSLVCNILRAYHKEHPFTLESANTDQSALFRLLLSKCSIPQISNIISRYYNFDEYFNHCDPEHKVSLLENSMPLLCDKVDVMKFIDENSTWMDRAVVNSVILKFLEAKHSTNGNVSGEFLVSGINYLIPECDLNLRIITLIVFFYKKIINKIKLEGSGDIITIFSPKLIEMVRFEIFEGKGSEDELLELLSSISGFILPTFTSLLIELNDSFANQPRHQKILRNLISYIKIQDFIEIVGAIDISKHHLVFKGISNVDIGVFLAMYRFYSKGIVDLDPLDDYSRVEPIRCVLSGTPTCSLDLLMSCLPSFCYYCTDYSNNASNLIRILKRHTVSHPTIINSALEKLIQSHKNNVENNVVLQNSIPKEDSLRILSCVKSSNIAYDLISIYTSNKNLEFDSTIQMAVDLCGIDLTPTLMSVIMGTSQDTSIYNALRLQQFFLGKCRFDFDFISRLLELCTAVEPDVQKKAYCLLYKIYSMKCTDVCICDVLFSSLKRTVNSSAERDRIRLQYVVLKSGCARCNLENRNEMINSFFTEIVTGAKDGNIKCRKIVKDIAIQMIDDDLFLNYLQTRMAEMSNDQSTVSGCVNVVHWLLEHMITNPEYLDKHLCSTETVQWRMNILIDALFAVGMHSLNVSKHVLNVFTFLVNQKSQSHLYSRMTGVVDLYIHQFSKKMNSNLRKFCISAEKMGLPLTKSMKTLLRFKNRSGKEKDIPVVERKNFSELL